MSDSISLPFLIIATGTILFVYMSVVIMELRSAYEESFWKQALKIGGIIFTLITLLFLGLDFVLTRFREKAFLLAPRMPILGIILVYMRSIVLAWRWRKRNPSHALIRMKRRGGFLKAVGAVILSVDGRADSKIESGCCGRKERIYSSRGAQAGNGGIYLAAPAVEYTVFSK